MFTSEIDAMASWGSPSQLMRELMIDSFQNSQLKTLKVGSNIHFHARVESTVGMMNGSRMKARTQDLPRKWRLSSSASPSPSPSLEAVGAPVETKVLSAAVRKIESSKTFSKLRRPMKWPASPTVASV